MKLQNLAEIKDKIKNGELILYEKHLYTPEQFAEYQACRVQEDNFDLLQLTKKIQLKSN